MPSPRSVPPPDPAAPNEDIEERGSRLMRFGAAVSAVLLSSVIATMPEAVRVAPECAPSCNAPTVWLALLTLAFAPLAFTTVVVRHALAALRLFDGRAVREAVATTIVWAFTTFAGLLVLGAFLRNHTHHHGLAGVTFAMFGLALAGLAAPFSIRAVAVVRGAPAIVRWTLLALAGCGAGVGVAFVTRTLGHTEASATFAVDAVAFTLATAFGAGAFPRRARPLALLAALGPPLAAVVLFVGVGALRVSAPLRAAVQGSSPALAFPLELAFPPATEPPSDTPPAPH